MKKLNSDICSGCVARSHFHGETSSFDLHVQKGVCALMWATGLKETVVVDLKVSLNASYHKCMHHVSLSATTVGILFLKNSMNTIITILLF